MGKETQIKEFTSPLGSQKEKLIRGFPLKFSDFLYLSTCEMVKKSGLFLSCCIIRFQISDFNLSSAAADTIVVQA